uniref:Uncharacterized protein n=1 Tax=Opuntia streptacantha TaxID=393608 RepID=A0A7C9CWL7_OPUST
MLSIIGIEMMMGSGSPLTHLFYITSTGKFTFFMLGVLYQCRSIQAYSSLVGRRRGDQMHVALPKIAKTLFKRLFLLNPSFKKHQLLTTHQKQYYSLRGHFTLGHHNL